MLFITSLFLSKIYHFLKKILWKNSTNTFCFFQRAIWLFFHASFSIRQQLLHVFLCSVWFDVFCTFSRFFISFIINAMCWFEWICWQKQMSLTPWLKWRKMKSQTKIPPILFFNKNKHWSTIIFPPMKHALSKHFLLYYKKKIQGQLQFNS